MNIIDFRFRPNTPETISGIQNSKMFKGLCESIDFSKMKPQTLDEVVVDLNHHNVVKAVITGRDCETTYGAKSNNESVTEFVSKYPEKFIGFIGLDPHKGMKAIAVQLLILILPKSMPTMQNTTQSTQNAVSWISPLSLQQAPLHWYQTPSSTMWRLYTLTLWREISQS